jgi:hypothetical protein
MREANGHAGKAAASLRAKFKESPLTRVELPVPADVAEARAQQKADEATGRQQGLQEQLDKLEIAEATAVAGTGVLSRAAVSTIDSRTEPDKNDTGDNATVSACKPPPVQVPEAWSSGPADADR